MYINNSGVIYTGDIIKGDREATAQEIADSQKKQNNSTIQSQLDNLDNQTGTTRVMREYLLSVNYKGFNNKIQTSEAQAIALRTQIQA